MYQYGINKIPKFIFYQKPDVVKKITKSQWEVRRRRVLAVKNSNIILLYGDWSEEDRLEFYALTHNMNLLLGISDDDYNLSISSP